MMKIASRCWLLKLTGIICCCSMVLMSSCIAAQPDFQQASAEESIRQFLQAWDDDISTQYIVAFRDLNADGTPEAIVYLTIKKWCGSGGCTMLILERTGSSWRVVTKTTVTRPPIRVLKKISNRWHNIGVWVEGGGIHPGYEAELVFDGKTYPTNPTIPPALQLKEKSAGVVVIPLSEDGKRP
jgi:hypothetical protein